MTTHARRSFGGLVAAVCAVALLGACSSGPGEITQSQLEDQIATQLAAETKQAKPTVTCPSGLEAKVDAELDCTLSAPPDPATYGVHVKVTSVDDETKTANFDIQVADQPNP